MKKKTKKTEKAGKLDLFAFPDGTSVRLRNGDVCTILQKDDIGPYVVRLSNGSWYTPDGSFRAGYEEDPFDVVEILSAPEPAPKPEPGFLRVADLIGKVLVIESDGNSGIIKTGSAELVGYAFKDEAAALAHIRKDSAGTFEDGGEITTEDLENWGSDCLIVEVKRVVRPVPTVKIGCEILTVAT